MKRILCSAAGWTAFFLFFAAACACAAGDDRHKAEQLFDELYGKDYKAALASATPADDVQLATQLHESASRFELPANLLVLIGDRVLDLTEKSPAAYEPAAKLMDVVAQKVPAEAQRATEKKLAMLQRVYDDAKAATHRQGAGRMLVEALAARGDALAEAGDAAAALADYQKAAPIASDTGSPLAAGLQQKLKQFELRIGQSDRIEAIKKKLADDPNDKDALTALLRILVVERDDPAAALEHIGDAADANLKKLLTLAAADGGDAEPVELNELGDWYRGLADQAAARFRLPMLGRASRYYQRFLGAYAANDLRRARVELRLKSVAQDIAAARARSGVSEAQAKLDAAIEQLIKYLFAQQKDGAWDHMYSNPHAGKAGVTALVTYALLQAGVAPDDARLAGAIARLRAGPEDHTYSTSLRARALALLPDHNRHLKPYADALVRTGGRNGLYSYTIRDGAVESQAHDHSNMGYAYIALWYADRAGLDTPGELWKVAAAHYVQAQQTDGGWNYRKGDDRPSYFNMTAECLLILTMARQKLYAAGPVPKVMTDAIERGERATAKLDRTTTRTGLYGLDILQRLARVSGIRYLDDEDWYEKEAATIATAVAARQHYGQVFDDAMALAFLAQSRHPRWCTKLVGPDGWDDAPDDVALLTYDAQRGHATPLRWQRVSIDQPVEQWADTPVAWISTDGKLDPTDAQLKKLKQFIDDGGMLVVSAANRNTGLRTMAAGVAKDMYPDLQVDRLPADHPILKAHYDLAPTVATRRNHMVLTDGDRVLMFICGLPWSVIARQPPGADDRQLLTNLAAWHTTRTSAAYRWQAPQK